MLNASISKRLRKEVYARDGFRCALCDCTQTIQIHHAIPRGEGGGNCVDNLITLCARCHAAAHGLDLDGTGITEADMAQLIVEYLADLYAEEWEPWESDPWGERDAFDLMAWRWDGDAD